jgi:hypothetical protein
MMSPRRHVRLVPILLQKSFCEVGLKFFDPYVQRLNNDAGDPRRQALNSQAILVACLKTY